jgi:hypothetical protein
VWGYFRLGEFANGTAKLLLFVGEGKIHKRLGGYTTSAISIYHSR